MIELILGACFLLFATTIENRWIAFGLFFVAWWLILHG